MTANAEIIAELRRVLNERDEARAEVERLKSESKIEQAFTNKYIKLLHDAEAKGADQFRRGAEAMREACAREIVEGRQNSHEGMMQWFEDIASDVRDLPIPEEK